jgi:hypothetical protein
MTCTVDARRACERVAAACDARDAVVSVDVLAPAQSPAGRWTLELHCQRPPTPAVLRALADHGLSIQDVCQRGAGYRLVAVVW